MSMSLPLTSKQSWITWAVGPAPRVRNEWCWDRDRAVRPPSGSIMLSSSGTPPVTVWEDDPGSRTPSRRNLLAGMILPRALPVKSGNRHSNFRDAIALHPALILSMLNPDFMVGIVKGVQYKEHHC